MKSLIVFLLCLLMCVPMLAFAQDQVTPAAAATPAAGGMPGMMAPAGGGGMGGMRGGMMGGGGMQMKTMTQEMMGYLKLCDEVKNNPADMEKVNKWTAADQATSQGMTGMAGMAAARGAATKETGEMLVDTLTMMKECKGIKDDKAKTDEIDAMITRAKTVAEATPPAEGEAAGGADPQAMRRQMFMHSATLQKLVPDTAKMMKNISVISSNTQATKGLDDIIQKGEQMQEGMKRMMDRMRQNQPAAPGAAAPGGVAPAAPNGAAPAGGDMTAPAAPGAAGGATE